MHHINTFLDRILNPPSKPCTVQKNRVYIKFQYLGPLSFHIRRTLRKLLNPLYPQIEFRFIFTNQNTIKNLFPYKDRISDRLQDNVIYQYDCVRCNSDVRYIGETTRNLATRIAEHQGVSEHTGEKSSSPPYSAIRDHCIEEHKSLPDADNFKIIARARSQQELHIIEAICITLRKPSLNKQIFHKTLLTL